MRTVKQFLKSKFREWVMNVIVHEIRVFGPRERLKMSANSRMVNTLFNTNSGCITIGEFSFAGHDVMIITGRHDSEKLLAERFDFPTEGGDITIGRGVWVGSGAIILGPSTIGDHAVIGAGAVVKGDVPPYAVVAGIPAKVIKYIQAREQQLPASSI